MGNLPPKHHKAVPLNICPAFWLCLLQRARGEGDGHWWSGRLGNYQEKEIYYARLVCLLVSLGAAHLQHDLVME